MEVIQFDGGAVSNSGTRGIGVILLEDNPVLKEISRKLVEQEFAATCGYKQ